MTTVRLDEAIEAILDAMVAVVRAAATTPGNPLASLRSVVRGDRARPMPDLPSLWIVPEPASNTHVATAGGRGIAETWAMPVRLAALVKSDDPPAAGRECVRLAARARSEVLRDRQLGLPYVADVTSTAFDAAVRRNPDNSLLYWADATLTVRFTVLEGP
ncbi:MAG TPA: hypothetical protein VLM76_09345 [Patescibacteria group bacterium]|nr:hypothetical protein [Patescibacteria group bacterium]